MMKKFSSNGVSMGVKSKQIILSVDKFQILSEFYF